MNKIEEIKSNGGILWFIEDKNNEWVSAIKNSEICNCLKCSPYGGGFPKYDIETTLEPCKALGFLNEKDATMHIIIHFLALDSYKATEHLFQS